MGKFDEWYERLFFGRIAHLPGRWVVVIALLFYPGALLPLHMLLGPVLGCGRVLHWSVLWGCTGFLPHED